MRGKVPTAKSKVAVLFLGNKKSGKDTAANIISANYHFKHLALFGPSKVFMSRLVGINPTDLIDQGPVKEKFTKQMQDFGTALQNIFGKTVLSESLLIHLRAGEDVTRLAVSDVRIPEDLEHLKHGLQELGFKVVVCGIARPGTFEYSGHPEHYSEDLNRATSSLIANDEIPEWCDCAVQNDRGLGNFCYDVLCVGARALSTEPMPRKIYKCEEDK